MYLNTWLCSWAGYGLFRVWRINGGSTSLEYEFLRVKSLVIFLIISALGMYMEMLSVNFLLLVSATMSLLQHMESPSGTQANILGVFSQHQKVTNIAALFQMGFKNEERGSVEEANDIFQTTKKECNKENNQIR